MYREREKERKRERDIYIYIYIERERDRERERDTYNIYGPAPRRADITRSRPARRDRP